MDTPDTVRATSIFVTQSQHDEEIDFQKKFEVEPFLFRHRLPADPRFEKGPILALARRLPRKIGLTGDLAIKNGFKQPEAERMTFEEALEQLEAGRCWIILKKVHQDPEYAPVLRECLAEVEELTHRRLEPLIESRTMSLILSSPGQVTPYHIDADCNFLFQIRGSKTFYAFNGRDRSILSEKEEESFWAGDLNAAHYREENQNKAWTFAMEPGNGVHVPVIFPHWVKNGNNVSISLSVNFRFHGKLRGDVYRMNHILRKMGVRPRPVGESALVDRLKALLLSPPRRAMLLTYRTLRRE